MALAERFPVPGLLKFVVLYALMRPIPVQRLPPPDLAHDCDDHGWDQAGADRLVLGDLPSAPEQKRH